MGYLFILGLIVYGLWNLGKDKSQSKGTTKVSNDSKVSIVTRNLNYVSEGLNSVNDGLELLNKRIAKSKRILEVSTFLSERFGYPCILEHHILQMLEIYKQKENMNVQPLLDYLNSPNLSPENKEFYKKLLEDSPNNEDYFKENQHTIDFLTSYQSWPLDLSPENYPIYIGAIHQFGQKRKEYDYKKKYPPEICRKYLKDNSKLVVLFSQTNKDDYLGTFLRYADAMEKGQSAVIKLDIQIRLLQCATTSSCSTNLPVEFKKKLEEFPKSILSEIEISDKWFTEIAFSDKTRVQNLQAILNPLSTYIDVQSLKQKLEQQKQKPDFRILQQLLEVIGDKDLSPRVIEKLDNRRTIENFIKTNQMTYLYHFTAKKNLNSIREKGGLFSWNYLRSHNIYYEGGGNIDSRSLDKRKNLENYVRLSFCKDHPMSYRVRQENNVDIVVLKIDPSILYEDNVMVSDINATDNNAKISAAVTGLSNINYGATQKCFVRRDDPDFKPHQAEILVPTTVPLKFIKGIL